MSYQIWAFKSCRSSSNLQILNRPKRIWEAYRTSQTGVNCCELCQRLLIVSSSLDIWSATHGNLGGVLGVLWVLGVLSAAVFRVFIAMPWRPKRKGWRRSPSPGRSIPWWCESENPICQNMKIQFFQDCFQILRVRVSEHPPLLMLECCHIEIQTLLRGFTSPDSSGLGVRVEVPWTRAPSPGASGELCKICNFLLQHRQITTGRICRPVSTRFPCIWRANPRGSETLAIPRKPHRTAKQT